MNGMMAALEARSRTDTKVRAILRRSLAFTPGTYVAAFPYIEPFVKDVNDGWRRAAHYLAGGLWAAHDHNEDGARGHSIGRACAAHQAASGSATTEARFLSLLEADTDQIAHRLRQLVALLKDQPIDFDGVLRGLLRWNDEAKPTQTDWARDFYRHLDREDEPNSASQEAAAP